MTKLKSVMSNNMCRSPMKQFMKHLIIPVLRRCRSGHAKSSVMQTWAGDNLTLLGLEYVYCYHPWYGYPLQNQGCDIGGFYGVSRKLELLGQTSRMVSSLVFQSIPTNIDNTVTGTMDIQHPCTEYIRTAIGNSPPPVPLSVFLNGTCT